MRSLTPIVILSLLLAALPAGADMVNFASLAPPLLPPQAGGGPVALVVNPGVNVTDLSLADVRKIFRGERQYWKADLPVVLLVRAPGARERDVALRVVYQMTEAQYKQFWVAKVFRAEAVAVPKPVYSSDMTVQLVSSLPGAISFMEARQAGDSVKVVRVDGKLPSDASYPLK